MNSLSAHGMLIDFSSRLVESNLLVLSAQASVLWFKLHRCGAMLLLLILLLLLKHQQLVRATLPFRKQEFDLSIACFRQLRLRLLVQPGARPLLVLLPRWFFELAKWRDLLFTQLLDTVLWRFWLAHIAKLVHHCPMSIEVGGYLGDALRPHRREVGRTYENPVSGIVDGSNTGGCCVVVLLLQTTHALGGLYHGCDTWWCVLCQATRLLSRFATARNWLCLIVDPVHPGLLLRRRW